MPTDETLTNGKQQPKEYDAESFERLKTKHQDDLSKLARMLHEDAWKARRRAQAAEAKLPPEGGVVLVGDDAKAWAAYQALGKAEDVKKALDESKGAQGELAKVQREKLIREAAEAHGFRPAVLGRLAGELPIELKTEEKDGKTVKTALVKDAGKDVPLPEYAEGTWADFMPSLRAEAQQQTGTLFVPQSSGGKAPKQDPASAYIGRAYADPNKK